MEAKEQQGEERRRAVRRELSIPCQTTAVGFDGQEMNQMFTRDVSQTGAFLKTDRPFPLASEIRMILDLGKIIVKAIGEVVRVEAEGMAVAFMRTEVVPVRVTD